VDAFLERMARRYDGNPNVAFIDIGHFGMWGEGHNVITTPRHGKEWGLETGDAEAHHRPLLQAFPQHPAGHLG